MSLELLGLWWGEIPSVHAKNWSCGHRQAQVVQCNDFHNKICLIKDNFLKFYRECLFGTIERKITWHGHLDKTVIHNILITFPSQLQHEGLVWSNLHMNLVTWVPTMTKTPKKFQKFNGVWATQVVTKWSKKARVT